MPFDRESGQIYEEVLKQLPKKDEDDLVYVAELGHIRERPTSRCSMGGTRTLHIMAMLKILRSLDLLSSDLLKALPLPILEQIWKAVKLNGLDGLRMWKLFAPILASTDGASTMVRKDEKRLQSSFAHAINQISCVNCSWLTELTLANTMLSMAEYAQLSKMQNLNSLAVLARSVKDAGFSDRVLRAWAADAKNGGFAKLQFVFIGGYQSVTEQSLAYLDSFQVLDLFCVQNCRFDAHLEDDTEGETPSLPISEGWHDPLNGSFRSFLKSKSATFDRLGADAPFPSSFHAYTAQYRRAKASQSSRVPRLLMTLLPESRQDARSIFGKEKHLRCFERVPDAQLNVQAAKANDTPHRKKRRKLKDKKVTFLGDMLAGLT